MRDLKFKAWSIKEKFMHTVAGIDWTVAYGRWYGPGVGKGVFYLDSTYKGKRSINEVDTILMQYTGLKDKNGVDIYEGDILCLDKLEDARWEIKYSGASFIGVPLKYNSFVHHRVLHNNNYLQFTVIGNIHENSELLINN